MAVEVINIGNIANDGTGDDLREAFRKVNDNFDDLDTRFPEAATGVNLSQVGEGIFASATNSELSFKTLIGGANINLTATDSTITLDVPDSLGQLIAITDSGSVVVNNGQTLGVNGGTGLTTSASGQNLIIEATDGILSQDGSPELSATLDANTNNITNAGTVTANTFNGSLEGLVYGVDIRDISRYFTGFDMGNFRQEYSSAVEFILSETDLDLGAFVGADVTGAIVDLGAI
jgi:hypothetical protein